jgi:uncharacterized protein YegL
MSEKNVRVVSSNPNLTEIILVLDKSGSMHDVKKDTIGGVNQFLEDQKKLPGEALFTFITFDTKYNKISEGILLENAQPLSEANYSPNGGTALFDAVNSAISSTIERHANESEAYNRPGKVMLVVLTDGEENSSTEIRDVKAIGRMVAEREKAGWEVIFLGADLDNWAAMGSGMGFSKFGNMSKSDMSNNYKKMSNHTAMYRSSATPVGATLDNAAFEKTFNLSEEELDQQMKDLQAGGKSNT